MLPSPKNCIGKGSIFYALTVFFAGIILFVLCNFLQPADMLALGHFPLNVGLVLLLKCSYSQATLVLIPARFAAIYGFVFSYGKLLSALSESNLLPNILKRKTGLMPFSAIASGSIIGYCICFGMHFIPNAQNHLRKFCFISSYFIYCAFCVCHICLKKKYSTITFHFSNPAGIYGSFFALTVFAFGLISAAFFQKDNCIPLVMFLVLMLCSSMYYFAVAKHFQQISEEERQSLFVAHIIKFNTNRANARVHGNIAIDRRRELSDNHLHMLSRRSSLIQVRMRSSLSQTI